MTWAQWQAHYQWLLEKERAEQESRGVWTQTMEHVLREVLVQVLGLYAYSKDFTPPAPAEPAEDAPSSWLPDPTPFMPAAFLWTHPTIHKEFSDTPFFKGGEAEVGREYETFVDNYEKVLKGDAPPEVLGDLEPILHEPDPDKVAAQYADRFRAQESRLGIRVEREAGPAEHVDGAPKRLEDARLEAFTRSRAPESEADALLRQLQEEVSPEPEPGDDG